MVALAGIAAQWLYRDSTLGGGDVRRDKGMAAKILPRIEPDSLVEEPWREYLHQRALSLIAEPQRQFLI